MHALVPMISSLVQEAEHSCRHLRAGAESVAGASRQLLLDRNYQGWYSVWLYLDHLLRGAHAHHQRMLNGLDGRLREQIVRAFPPFSCLCPILSTTFPDTIPC